MFGDVGHRASTLDHLGEQTGSNKLTTRKVIPFGRERKGKKGERWRDEGGGEAGGGREGGREKRSSLRIFSN